MSNPCLFVALACCWHQVVSEPEGRGTNRQVDIMNRNVVHRRDVIAS